MDKVDENFDVEIAKKIAHFFNATFYNGLRFIEEGKLLDQIERCKSSVNLEGGYISHHIVQNPKAELKIVLTPQEENLAKEKLSKLKNAKDEETFTSMIAQHALIAPCSIVSNLMTDLILVLYHWKYYIAFENQIGNRGGLRKPANIEQFQDPEFKKQFVKLLIMNFGQGNMLNKYVFCPVDIWFTRLQKSKFLIEAQQSISDYQRFFSLFISLRTQHYFTVNP